jgi:hypothetical protein
LGESDESQLEWAETEGRAFLTFNAAHFAHCIASGCNMDGIVAVFCFRINGRSAIYYDAC